MLKQFKTEGYNLRLTAIDCASEDSRIAAELGITSKRLASLPAPVEPMKGNGVYLRLDKEPCSAAANALIEALLARITPTGGRKTDEMRQGVGALVGDLLIIGAGAADGYAYRPMGSGTFSGERVGYNPFKRVIQRLHDAGYIEVVRGKAAPPIHDVKGRATTIRPQPSLLETAESYGITPANSHRHFRSVFEPVMLKAASTSDLKFVRGKWRWQKDAGRKMRIDVTHSRVLTSTKMLTEINDVLTASTFVWSKPDIPPPRLQRIFNNGDTTGTNYDKGGRLYSPYQSLSQRERAATTINGERTCEIDISSSYATIANARLGLHVDKSKDLYHVPDFPRLIVKDYVNCSLGCGKPISGWPAGVKEDYNAPDEPSKPNAYKGALTLGGYAYPRSIELDFPIASLKKHVKPKFPMLERIESEGIDWALLSYVESCVVLETVHELCTVHGIPVLPVHDSIICPVSQAELVEDILKRRFKLHVGVEPRLKRK